MNRLDKIFGIGPKTIDLLKKLEINSIDDLVSYYPYRYDIIKRSNLLEIKDGDKVIIDGMVLGQPTLIYLSKKLKKIIFRINTGRFILNITVYNKVYLIDNLKSGIYVTIIGKYDKIKNSIIASDIRLEKLPDTPVIEPVYYTTSGLSRKNISKYINFVLLDNYSPRDYVPKEICDKYEFLSKIDSIKEIHNPSDINLLKKARQRLKYEELFMYLLKINYLKEKKQNMESSLCRKIDYKEVEKLIKELPFELTKDQKQTLEEIFKDMESSKRMNRLIQGDVGSGKTIVALLSIYANYLSGYQSALMVPTEILANQHYEDATKIFKNTKLRIELLSSSTKKSIKLDIYEKLKNNEVDLIIGTQSLIQDSVQFANLGLVITDEQHRFGVNQRLFLRNKGGYPDVLSMSATPIPRTYALTIYGDMDVSSIKTKPLGRKDVITYYKREKEITNILELMKKEIDNHHQIYVIAPQVVDDNASLVENVSSLEDKMNRAFSKIAKVGSIYGKLDTKEKNRIMNDFENGKIDILISTTVIEVGVNVKNASMIVIFDANMFGLSTIHQLRGRVGRSNIQSYCILISKDHYDRLKMLEKCNDGFEISEYDFKNRGEGDLFGIKQSGDVFLKLANVKRDFQMLLKAREDVMLFLPKYLEDSFKYLDIKNKLEEIDIVE